METVRKIVSVATLAPVMDLPWKAKDMQVEVIVMPFDEEKERRPVTGRNLKGCLKKYAQPGLQEKEPSAWENHIVEKYLNKL